MLLKKHNIPICLWVGKSQFGDLLHEENYVANDWGYWSRDYPDARGTGHCDYTGHRLVHKAIWNKVEQQL